MSTHFLQIINEWSRNGNRGTKLKAEIDTKTMTAMIWAMKRNIKSESARARLSVTAVGGLAGVHSCFHATANFCFSFALVLYYYWYYSK